MRYVGVAFEFMPPKEKTGVVHKTKMLPIIIGIIGVIGVAATGTACLFAWRRGRKKKPPK